MGVEPTTCRLRIGCSTTELPRPLIIKDLFSRFKPCVQLAFQTIQAPVARGLTQPRAHRLFGTRFCPIDPATIAFPLSMTLLLFLKRNGETDSTQVKRRQLDSNFV